MGAFIHTLDEAIAEVAEILELATQKERIIRCTVRIMQCLNHEPREFLADSQALLIEGGLEALRKKRHDLLETLDDDLAIAVLNEEEDELLDSVGSSVDALRLSEVAYRVFPGLAKGRPRWRVARALRRDERNFQAIVSRGIRREAGAREDMERLVDAHAPPWTDRAKGMHPAFREFAAQLSEGEAETLYGVFALDDERMDALLSDLEHATERLAEMSGVLEALKSLQE
jgi:hypothetical protein